MSFKDLRTLSDVPRWTVLRTLRKQSVADHSYYVAVYALAIMQRLPWSDCNPNVVNVLQLIVAKRALVHDIPESFTSDIPGPVKQHMDGLKEYEETGIKERFNKELNILNYNTSDIGYNFSSSVIKLADILDQISFLASESFMGNKNVYWILGNAKLEMNKAISTVADKFAYVMACDGHENNSRNAALVELNNFVDSVVSDEEKQQTLPK